MTKDNNLQASPLLSFDFYLESYHRLLGNLKKEADLKKITYLLGEEISQENQSLIIKENYDALVVTDPDHSILWVNDGFIEMTGYRKNYALQKKPSFLQGKETSKTIKKEIREQLNAHHSFDGAVINYRKNGEPYLCHIKILPHYSPPKKLSCFIALEKELKAA